MQVFSRQQLSKTQHQKKLMSKSSPLTKLNVLILILFALFLSGCKNPFSPKSKQKTATLLKTDNASQEELLGQIDYFAKVDSMRAKMYLKFEDNSYAQLGIAEKYKSADGEVVVQRPAKILLKVKVPIIKSDVAQMTSDGEKFRVAILQDGGSGKYKKFILGTNATDYSLLQKKVIGSENGDSKETKKNVNAFSNLRPQHFTDAMLVRPVDKSKYTYVQSTIVLEEVDFKLVKKKSPLGWVLRGYYLVDEFRKNDDGTMSVSRRFWFDRVGGINLARQQIFDAEGEIDSDIVYGKKGILTKNGGFNLPLQVQVTRPKEKYSMKLTYQTPKSVLIGRKFPDKAFLLENRWDLEVYNLDEQLKAFKNQSKSAKPATTRKTNDLIKSHN